MEAGLALYWWRRLITFGIGRIRVNKNTQGITCMRVAAADDDVLNMMLMMMVFLMMIIMMVIHEAIFLLHVCFIIDKNRGVKKFSSEVPNYLRQY